MSKNYEANLTGVNKLKAVALLGITVTAAAALYATDKVAAEVIPTHKAKTHTMAHPHLHKTITLNDVLAHEAEVIDANPNLSPDKKAYDKLVGEVATRIAYKYKNDNPEVVKDQIEFEGGWQHTTSDGSNGGNLSGVKCVDDNPHPGCGPMTKTTEDNGNGLVTEYHRFQILPGRTLREKVTSTAIRMSNLFRRAGWFNDVQIASHELDPKKNFHDSLLALQNKTDGHGHIIAAQGEPGVKSYASLRPNAQNGYMGYPERLEEMQRTTHSDEAFSLWYEMVAQSE